MNAKALGRVVLVVYRDHFDICEEWLDVRDLKIEPAVQREVGFYIREDDIHLLLAQLICDDRNTVRNVSAILKSDIISMEFLTNEHNG